MTAEGHCNIVWGGDFKDTLRFQTNNFSFSFDATFRFADYTFYPFIKKLKGGAAKISFATPPFYVLTLSIFGTTPRARVKPSVLFYRLEPMKTPRVCFTPIAKVLNFS